MYQSNSTGLYLQSAGSTLIAHHLPAGHTMAIWTEPSPGAGLADLTLFRHLILEADYQHEVTMPGRKPRALIRQEPRTWRKGPPRNMRLIAKLDHDELTINHQWLGDAQRHYLGIPDQPTPASLPHVTRMLSYADGTIQLVKDLFNGVHLTEPAYDLPTGISDLLRFHTQYKEMDQNNTQPWGFSFATPGSIAVMTHDDFRNISREARNVATADNQRVTIDLGTLWPIDRLYLGLLHTATHAAPP